MAKGSKTSEPSFGQPKNLKGWKQIAEFLGEPVSVVKRWRSEGMPITQQGRFVTSSSDQLNTWMSRDSGKPVHVVTSETDLRSELKRAIAFARQGKTRQNHG